MPKTAKKVEKKMAKKIASKKPVKKAVKNKKVVAKKQERPTKAVKKAPTSSASKVKTLKKASTNQQTKKSETPKKSGNIQENTGPRNAEIIKEKKQVEAVEQVIASKNEVGLKSESTKKEDRLKKKEVKEAKVAKVRKKVTSRKDKIQPTSVEVVVEQELRNDSKMSPISAKKEKEVIKDESMGRNKSSKTMPKRKVVEFEDVDEEEIEADLEDDSRDIDSEDFDTDEKDSQAENEKGKRSKKFDEDGGFFNDEEEEEFEDSRSLKDEFENSMEEESISERSEEDEEEEEVDEEAQMLMKAKELGEKIVEEVVALSEDYNLADIREAIRGIDFFNNSESDECSEKYCENLQTTLGFCRFHYIKNWKTIKKKQAILSEGKLQQYIEELIQKYPPKYIEIIINDLSGDKQFYRVLKDLNIDTMFQYDDSAADLDTDDDISAETRGFTGGRSNFDEEDIL